VSDAFWRLADRLAATHALVIDRPAGSRHTVYGDLVYPLDYGYLIGHRGRDGDPLDVMVCVSEPTFPGCVIPVKPIALFKMHDEKGEDDKIVCVPRKDPGWNHAEVLDDIPQPLQREIEHFFSIYKQLEDKIVTIEGWRSREEALYVCVGGAGGYVGRDGLMPEGETNPR